MQKNMIQGIKGTACLALCMLVATLLLTSFLSPVPTANAANTFTNALQQGADPSLVYYNGNYYLTGSYDPDGNHTVRIYKASTLEGLKNASPITVFTPGQDGLSGGSECCEVWAASLKQFGDRWYIYYTADDGNNANHRMHVLQSSSNDPLSSYTEMNRLYDPNNDFWAIDGTAFQFNNNYYFVWSGWPQANSGFPENLYIASMSNPWTLSSGRVLISEPTNGWEQVGAAIDEAPDVLQHNGKLFITYSASGANTPDYKLGMLTYNGGDLLNINSWSKSANPVFQRNDSAGVFGPGSNSFFKSPDGSEDWIAYHAKTTTNIDFGDRTIRAQKFGWNGDNTPNFGVPLSTANSLQVPSGEGPSPNLIANTGFENDGGSTQNPSGWSTWPGNSGNDADADYTESYGGSHSGNFHGTHYKGSAYQVYTYQTITNIPNGTYNLTAWVESGGGQNADFMSAKDYGNNVSELTANIPAASNWTLISVSGINVTNNQITVGFYSLANAGNWDRFDDVQLVQQ